MSEHALTVNILSVNFHGQHLPAVCNVSFSLRKASVFGIIGESGAGKSSLALALLGLHDRRAADVAGEVVFQGINLIGLQERELCKVRGSGVGMIFQDPMGALDPSMKVVDQLAEVIRMQEYAGRDESKRMAVEQLREVGIPKDVIGSAPHAYQLSGGLCQRAMIAMALASKPEVLIADEPTSSLDLRLQEQMISLLSEQQKRNGLSIVFISHDLSLVSSFADEIMVLHRGEPVESGRCEEVFGNPSNEYTKSLVRVWGQYGHMEEATAIAPA